MLLDELKQYLITTVPLTSGEVFTGILPDTPDACVAVLEYGGVAPEYIHDSASPAIEFPRVQVLTRGAQYDYETARTKAEAVYGALSRVSNQTLSGTFYLSIRPLQTPFVLDASMQGGGGRDENGRVTVAFNVEVMRRR